uniref:C2H2-type domain-containing protein n=1 Tax=Neogobius melanostomus TaxID=47308 RepID=A0A8C6SYQ0_9GOBI
MSKLRAFRAFVNERLAAAAEDICAMFERTMAGYEEELRRYEEENQRKQQQLLDPFLYLRIDQVRGNVQFPSTSPGPSQNEEIRLTPWIKEEPEEQRVTQEEEQTFSGRPFPVSSAACVKSEESSLLQRQTEHREETQGENTNSESKTEGDTADTDNDDDWEPTGNCLAAQVKTEADGRHYKPFQSRDRSSATQKSALSPECMSAPETSAAVNDGDMSEADSERKKHQCSVCKKRFCRKSQLHRHVKVHTGEKPFRCSTCKKTFAYKNVLKAHSRTHTGEKPYTCSTCKKTFTRKSSVKRHMSVHI